MSGNTILIMKKSVLLTTICFFSFSALAQNDLGLTKPIVSLTALAKYITQDDAFTMTKFIDSCQKYLPLQDSTSSMFFDSIFNRHFSTSNANKDNLIRMQAYAILQKKFAAERKVVNDYNIQISGVYQQMKAVRDTLLKQSKTSEVKIKTIDFPEMQVAYDRVSTPTNGLWVYKNLSIKNLIKPLHYNNEQRQLLLKALDDKMRKVKDIWDANLEVEHYLIDTKSVFQQAVEQLLAPYLDKTEEDFEKLFEKK